MLGWVITCHGDRAQEILDTLKKKHRALLRCRAMNFWRGLSPNMLSRMMCGALHETSSSEDIIFLTDIAGASPYRMASLLNHKHSRCEMTSGVMLPLIEQVMACRETMTSSEFREHIVELGGPKVSSLWHQQQGNPLFVLKHSLYEH